MTTIPVNDQKRLFPFIYIYNSSKYIFYNPTYRKLLSLTILLDYIARLVHVHISKEITSR